MQLFLSGVDRNHSAVFCSPLMLVSATLWATATLTFGGEPDATVTTKKLADSDFLGSSSVHQGRVPSSPTPEEEEEMLAALQDDQEEEDIGSEYNNRSLWGRY